MPSLPLFDYDVQMTVREYSETYPQFLQYVEVYYCEGTTACGLEENLLDWEEEHNGYHFLGDDGKVHIVSGDEPIFVKFIDTAAQMHKLEDAAQIIAELKARHV